MGKFSAHWAGRSPLSNEGFCKDWDWMRAFTSKSDKSRPAMVKKGLPSLVVLAQKLFSKKLNKKFFVSAC
ncbi:hypothetical protein PthBH41_33870 [Parageobacillus thermoglucosidasius]|uniref:hypothetical protein n=1 Tax=Parageobacillus thermoglucosidasius TaxID=1426 RepID=UPI001FCB1FE4|nr:hypothetical protein [Parageobacillus thermoglucosidasius]BDG33675.1 hypothetical protein PthBH41_33870 [Parageobacillus thermoglucosidasius]